MLLELVLIYLLVRGAAEAWRETRAAWGKSRRAYTGSAARRYPGMSPGRRAGHALRHDAGYGLSQLLHGFPQGRHGFAQGWDEGRQAHVEARTAREQARTERAETHAGAIVEWQRLRERRREALEEIRRQKQGEGSRETAEGSPGEARGGACIHCEAAAGEECMPWCPTQDEDRGYCAYCGTRDDRQCPPRCASWTLRGEPYPGRENDPAYSYGPEGATSGWPSATAEHAHEAARHASTDGDPWVVTEYPPGGGPGRTIAAYRNGESTHVERIQVWGVQPDGGTVPLAEEYGDEAQALRDGFDYEDCEICGAGLDQHDIAPDALGHAHAYCRTTTDQPTPDACHPAGPTEGTTSMSDVTYDGVVREMNAAVSNAETRAAEVNAAGVMAEEQAQNTAEAKGRASRTADEMQALDMDPATLGAMADHLDALEAAEKAHRHVQEAVEAARKSAVRVMETAQNVSATMQRGHAGLAEAHQNAPVQAAAREFYQD